MRDRQNIAFRVVTVVVVAVCLSGLIGSVAGPLHRQPLRRSHTKQCRNAPADELERVRHILIAVNELCMRCMASPPLDLLAEIAVAESRAGDASKSAEMFELALKAASNIKDSRERYSALLGIAENQARAGMVDAAVRTSELASSSMHRSNLLGAIATTLSDAGYVQDALNVSKLIPEEYRETRIAAVCYIASDMATKGECSRALAVLERVDVDAAHANELYLSQKAGVSLTSAEESIVYEASCKAVGLLLVVECQAHRGRFVEAAKLAETNGFGRFRDRALRSTVSIAANAGNLEVAHRIATQIRDEEEKSLALSEVAVGEAVNGLLDDSLKTLSAIIRAQHKGETMMRIAVVLAQSGDHEKAEKMLLAAEKEQLEPATCTAAKVSIAQAFAEHGDFISAKHIAGGLTDQAARAKIMVAIGGAYAKTGNADDAQRSFQIGYECVLKIGIPYERTKMLREVASSQAAVKDYSGAARVLKEAARTAATMPAEGGTNVIALREVAVAQAKSGDQPAARVTFQIAVNAAKAYADEEYAARLCQDVMIAQVECGELETALEFANKLEPGVIKCRSLLGIALGLLQRGLEQNRECVPDQ